MPVLIIAEIFLGRQTHSKQETQRAISSKFKEKIDKILEKTEDKNEDQAEHMDKEMEKIKKEEAKTAATSSEYDESDLMISAVTLGGVLGLMAGLVGLYYRGNDREACPEKSLRMSMMPKDEPKAPNTVAAYGSTNDTAIS
ncbi:hypothetical protein CYMTET_9987 [Cymbomonas tetramitiformis]|uniref:Uncharacterized protein n=1 Tax=Cymbomonas tetramitiformis TaxID=36881 RepID=A0AAE0GQ12_9CHLO|nr:hypothetical protein CYMTET_9987 [Cymbomonas tetramitiformis]